MRAGKQFFSPYGSKLLSRRRISPFVVEPWGRRGHISVSFPITPQCTTPLSPPGWTLLTPTYPRRHDAIFLFANSGMRYQQRKETEHQPLNSTRTAARASASPVSHPYRCFAVSDPDQAVPGDIEMTERHTDNHVRRIYSYYNIVTASSLLHILKRRRISWPSRVGSGHIGSSP